MFDDIEKLQFQQIKLLGNQILIFNIMFQLFDNVFEKDRPTKIDGSRAQ